MVSLYFVEKLRLEVRQDTERLRVSVAIILGVTGSGVLGGTALNTHLQGVDAY